MLNTKFRLGTSIIAVIITICCSALEITPYRDLAEMVSIPLYEWQSLEDLFDATDGDHWHWDNATTSGQPWNFTTFTNPCTQMWQGLNCSFEAPYEYYHITHINLNRLGMKGILPDTIGNLNETTIFSISENKITGPIPTSLCELTSLSVLELYNNKLNGTIPACLGNTNTLKRIDLSRNSLTGFIPSTLANIRDLELLGLNENRLNGPIPSEFGSFSKLLYLYLNLNRLTGTLPDTFSGLTLLRQLLLDNNKLSGPLPFSLGDLKFLTELTVRANNFTGPIPHTWGNIHSLERLILQRNFLTGNIPDSFRTLDSLRDLDLSSNRFNGTIPAFLGSLPKLDTLYLSSNSFYGTIPSGLCYAKKLRIFHADTNGLTGKIPSDIGQLAKIEAIKLYTNKLTGAIPDAFGNLSTLVFADFSFNALRGQLPASMGTLTKLKYLYLENNELSGTLPAEWGDMQSLSEFNLANNQLHGSIPLSFSSLAALSLLILSYNKLTGPIDKIVNPALQTSLNSVQINNNQLTGTIPGNMFELSAIAEFVAGTNCFSGSLPAQLCEAQSLLSLSLDGLSSAETCRMSLIPGFDSFARLGRFHTELGDCYFHMHSLKTLHLSDIGLRGTLPPLTYISRELLDLALAHNSLSGTIPEVMQTKVFESLDLSYNRLTGTLSEDFASDVADELHDERTHERNSSISSSQFSLFLLNNRLSGVIPPSVTSLRDLSILGSNVFSCNYRRTDLPSHNEKVDNYDCASQTFDVAYYTWLVLVFASVCALFGTLYANKIKVREVLETEFALKLHRWLKAASGDMFYSAFADRLKTLTLVSRVCDLLCLVAVYCLAFILLIALPLYVAMGHYYGTLTHQYAYAVSMAFVSGVPPTVVEILVLLGLMTTVIMMLLRHLFKLSRRETDIRSNARTSRRMEEDSIVVAPAVPNRFAWLRNSSLYVLFAFVNLCVVVGANSAYIYFVLNASGWTLITAQVFVGLFKIVWNGAGSTYLVRLVKKNLIETDNTAMQKSARETRLIMLQIFVALINNIAVPCAVTAVVSPSCFYYVFEPARTIKTPFRYTVCGDFAADQCVNVKDVPTLTEYQPSFSYSYQCSSSIVQFYAPAFISVCVITTFLTPVGQLLLQYWHRRATPGTLWYRVLHRTLPSILKPLPDAAVDIKDPSYKGFFQANHLLILLTNYLGLLLTFGAVFPPLAVALTVTLLSVTTFIKLKLGRFLTNAVSQNRFEYIDLIEAECQHAGAVEVLRRSAWLMLGFTCAFFTIFVFDSLGDSVGFEKAYWVLIVLPLLPLIFMGAVTGARKVSLWWRGDSAETKKARILSGRFAGDIEMKSNLSIGTLDSRDSADSRYVRGSSHASMNITMSEIYGEPTMNALVLPNATNV